MTETTASPWRRTTAAIALALLLIGVSVPASATPEPRPEEVLIFGDSISAQYTDDPGETMQGWWSILAAERNMTPYLSAQGGGAILKPGFGCYGSGIRDRFQEVVERVQPDEIWIASGRNETSVCIDGSGTPVNAGFRTTALNNFFAFAAGVADDNGIPRSRVYVTTPWGTINLAQRHDIVIDHVQARDHGLRFVNIPRLGDELTRDGTHPNREGSEYIANTLAASMPGPASEPTPVCE
jgi:lysophospholipase L1-like esterase